VDRYRLGAKFLAAYVAQDTLRLGSHALSPRRGFNGRRSSGHDAVSNRLDAKPFPAR
jgi:hypothetical protein